MKTSVVALSGFAAFASATPVLLNSNYQVTEGKPFELRFSGCSSSCSILLKTGASTNLETFQTLTGSTTGNTFTFTPSGIPSGTYAFEIKSGSEVNYSPQFAYTGTGSASVSSSSSPSTSASSSLYPTSSAPSSSVSVTVPVTTSTSTAPYQTSILKNTTTVAASNSTAAAPTSATGTGALTTGSSSPTRIPDSGVARLSSPMALIAGAIAAMAYLS